METIQVNLTFDQIKQALLKLPPQERMALWRLLDAGLDRQAIARKFASAVAVIHKTYAYAGEEDVMADAVKAVRETRKARYGKGRS